MGILTRGELRAQAGLASGNDQSTSFLNTWLDAWLARTAKSWAWPTLKARLKNVAVTAGERRVDIGLGLGGTSNVYLHRVFNPLFINTADYKQRGRVLIRELLDGNVDKDEDATGSGSTGTPTTVKIRTASPATTVSADPAYPSGAFTLYLDPVPDKAYLLQVDTHYIPAPLASDDDIPWYPSDRTLLQVCKCALMELDDGGEGGKSLETEMMKLAAMVVDDRDFDGEGPGDNQLMGLDKGVFL